MSATIKDVAKYSGISIATISKYLNGAPVRKTTREKIDLAIQELKYVPSSVARGLRNSKTMTLGIVVDLITNQFYELMISRLSSLLRVIGYSCIIIEADPKKHDNFIDSLEFLHDKRVDGLFIITNYYLPTPICDEISAIFENIVIIDSMAEKVIGDFVLTDNHNAAYYATEQFINAGHRKIAIITGNDNYLSALERRKGYERALEDYHIELNPDYILRDEYDTIGSYTAFKRFAKILPELRPTALLLTSYYMTMGAVLGMNEYRINYPDDISVITFDNYDFNKALRPKLSTFEQPHDQIAESAIKCMLDRINGKSSGHRIIRLAHRYIEGDSVKRFNL